MADARQPLSSAESQKLASADRNVVVTALGRLPISGTQTWLDTANVYAESASSQLTSDSKKIPPQQLDQFADYMAAAAFIHATDGWAYLGRALHSLLQGDVHGAVHLCYYAELRAAIALLSAEGVYVGNFLTLAITGGGADEICRDGTHVAAWKSVDAWSRSARARDLVGTVVRPIGASLQEWADNMGGGIQPVLESLFRDIAFDLSSFADDRERRNHVSYQPTRVQPDDLSADATASIVEDVWRLLEPDARGTFPVLDKLLMRHILVGVYAPSHAVLDQDGEDTGVTDWSVWGDWLDAVVPATASGDPYFLDIRRQAEDHARDSPLESAFVRSSGPVSAYVREVFLRTTVLARLATGACVQLFGDSGLDSEAIADWVSGLGDARALWPRGEQPEALIDLWSDAQLAAEELGNASKDSHHSIITVMGQYLAVLGQTERVAAWSFAS